MDLAQRREAAQEEHRRQLQARLDAERKAGEREREQQLLDDLAAGRPTSRMERATGLLRYYGAVAQGRWAPHAERQVGDDTMLDGGAAVHTADDAARTAVAEALAPMIAAAEQELEAATTERDKLVDEHRPHGLVGWLRR
jgi:hypothetical protein